MARRIRSNGTSSDGNGFRKPDHFIIIEEMSFDEVIKVKKRIENSTIQEFSIHHETKINKKMKVGYYKGRDHEINWSLIVQFISIILTILSIYITIQS